MSPSPSPIFSGTYKNRLDAKGRVSLPAEFRQALIHNGDGERDGLGQESLSEGFSEKIGTSTSDKAVYAFPSPRGHRLEALCPAHFHSICASIEERAAMFSDDEDTLIAQIVAAARRIAFDNNGRILLPKEFLESIGLSDTVVFVGFARRFVIFSEERFERWYKERRKHHLAPLASRPAPS